MRLLHDDPAATPARRARDGLLRLVYVRATMAEFAHLHVHTQYSFLVSTVKLYDLAPRVKELGMRAVAVTGWSVFFFSPIVCSAV